MRRSILALSSLFPLLLTFACDPSGGGPRGDGGLRIDGGEPVDTSDEDGDAISDSHEGRRDSRDSDADGTPDFLDDDSDGDGIPDSIEAGDPDIATPPRDSDSDGMADFIDLDADNNGIPDTTDGTADSDGDGTPDFADLDDDDDFVQDRDEVGDHTAMPWADNEGDGIPDFRDPDSDNDSILDGHERTGAGEVDTDGDGMADWRDNDSDDDGISDLDEAGDADLRTAPIDSDMDTIADYRDPDSDNDGVSDATELEAGSSRTTADTDGDGVSDLIEIGAGTSPTDAADSPRTRGDFVFVVPYMMPPDPTRDTLEFETSLQFADIYFGFDTTGSMSAELSAMRDPTAGVPAIVNMLRCAETTTACAADTDCAADEVCNSRGLCAESPRAGTGCIPDIWTGVGVWDELDTFRNIVSLQPDPASTAGAIPGTGGGAAEAPLQAPACVADGMNCTNTTKNCAAMGIGCPGFRDEAVRIYIQITDADDQCSGSRCSMFTAAYTGSELMRQSIKFISLVGTGDDSGGPTTPDSIARDIGIASATVDGSGVPYVYAALDAAVVPQTVAAVRDLVNADGFRVTIDATDEPDDDGDSIQFIDHLEVNVSGAGRCTMISPTEDTDGDGFDDAFPALRPGTPVCWDVVPLQNDTVMPDIRPLVFKARLTVRADGSPVDSRIVFFLVPPMIPDPGGPD